MSTHPTQPLWSSAFACLPTKLRHFSQAADSSPVPTPHDETDGSSLNPRLVRALDHPIRVTFLKLLTDRETITPVEALSLLSEKGPALSNVAYHAGVLEYLEMVEATGDQNPSGGPTYRATPKGEAALMALGFCGD